MLIALSEAKKAEVLIGSVGKELLYLFHWPSRSADITHPGLWQ